MTWFKSSVAIFWLSLLAQAQVKITDRNTVHFESLSQRSTMVQEAAPAMQISFKTYHFVIQNNADLNQFRKPEAGRKALGRVLLITTCSADCDSKDPQLSRTIFVDVAANETKASEWTEAAIVDRFGMAIQPGMFKNPELEFAVNGALIHSSGGAMHIGNSSISHYYLQVFERNEQDCRRYKAVYGPDAYSGKEDDGDFVSVELPWSRRFPQVANGIVVGGPKVYDTYGLKSMMNETLQKIKTINPFSAAQVTGNYGTLQGITRDQSYTNVQAQAGLPVPAATTTGVTEQTSYCPPGYVPYGPSACTASTNGSTATVPATSVTQTLTPPAVISPTIPAAPAYNPLPTSGTFGQSSSDALVEQVQLSGQLQMYELLLEGAQSDTLFVQNARAIATRAQTTIGFPISIDPPRQFKHAVAEVRVLIEPFPTPESGETQPVSIVNLLPSQKTYNVAKITSKQHSFGGGAVIEQVVGVGASTGKAKDRLYLAKDTDTVALQYDHPSVKPLHQPFPEKALTGLEEAVRMQRLDECDEEWFAVDAPERTEVDSKTSRRNSVMFGWQFRPVLGADYVAGGPRQVFAQLALPEGLADSTFLPAVLVQTRWREYDEKKQVVGPVFHSSCSVTSLKDPVILQNPLQVHDAAWEDTGSGILKIWVRGTFFSPGILMQSGKNVYAPVSFDGQELQFYAPAKDLLSNGEVSLVGENRQATSLTIPLNWEHGGCRLKSSSLWAIPQADGTARARLMLEPEEQFKSELPSTRPLILIGSDVYGLKDKPILNGRACDKSADFICVYHLNAQTDQLRAAGNYYVRELVWSNSNFPGAIRFAPFLSGLSSYSSEAKATPAGVTKRKTAGQKTAQSTSRDITYRLSGSDLKVFLAEPKALQLKIYAEDCPQGQAIQQQDLTVLSDTEALLHLAHAPKGNELTVAWTPTQWPLSQEAPLVWQLPLPGQSKPSSITAVPSFLNTGDSRTVTYTGGDFSGVQGVVFEGTHLNFLLSPDHPGSIDVTVPTSVTKEAGHKELVANTRDNNGKTGQIVLPIDVFKQ